MAQQDVGPESRLYAMMQHLMTVAAHGRLPGPAPDRGVVTRDDALDAVLQLAAVIDHSTQSGAIPVERGQHAAAMLMIVREFIQTLPAPPPRADGSDPVTPDLEELVKELRRQGGTAGVQG